VRLAAANAVARLPDRTPFLKALQACDQSEEYLQRLVPWLLGQGRAGLDEDVSPGR
jgi:hypothetical protein